MQSLGEIISIRKVEKSKITSKRQFLLKQLIDEIVLERKLDNWKRYKRIKQPMTPEEFKKTKEFVKPLNTRHFAVKMSHLSEHDLEYMLSVAKDHKRRGYSFSKYVFGSIKSIKK